MTDIQQDAGSRVRPGWWNKPFRMFQTNLREVDAGTLDVGATLDYLVDFGADTWLLNTGGIISNYPTDLAAQRTNPALSQRSGGDLIREATQEASRRGVRVVSRMDFSKVDRDRAHAHPEWLYVGPDGSSQEYNDLISVCPSGDYFKTVVPAVLTEIIDRYDVAGFFFNWWTFNEVDYSRRYRGVCQCRSCREGFALFAPGLPLPKGKEDSSYELWTTFARATLDDVATRTRALIAERAPHAAYLQGVNADVLFHEANSQIGRTLWHHRTADAISSLSSANAEKPTVVHSVCFVDMPYRWAGEDPDHFAQHLIQGLARGASPSTYLMGDPTVSTHECLAVARELTRVHRANAAVFAGHHSVAPALLIRPDLESVGGEALPASLEEYQGVHEMLVSSHIPFDVLDARNLTNSVFDPHRLSRWRVLILPDLGKLGGVASARIDQYVRAGGRVLTTGSTSIVVEDVTLAPPVAGEVVALVDERELLSYHIWLADTAKGDPVAAVGALYLAKPAPGVIVGMPVMGPAPYGPPEKCYGHEGTGTFARVDRAAGAGRVSSYLWSIGRSFLAYGAERLRGAFAGQLRERLLEEVYLPDASTTHIELIVAESRTHRVAHVLNRSGDRPGRFAPVATLRDEWVVLPWHGVDVVRSALSNSELPVEQVAEGIRVPISQLERYDILTSVR